MNIILFESDKEWQELLKEKRIEKKNVTFMYKYKWILNRIIGDDLDPGENATNIQKKIIVIK